MNLSRRVSVQCLIKCGIRKLVNNVRWASVWFHQLLSATLLDALQTQVSVDNASHWADTAQHNDIALDSDRLSLIRNVLINYVKQTRPYASHCPLQVHMRTLINAETMTWNTAYLRGMLVCLEIWRMLLCVCGASSWISTSLSTAAMFLDVQEVHGLPLSGFRPVLSDSRSFFGK